MLMVVFGAGASWDSANFDPTDPETMDWRPPMGRDLFADRKYFGPLVDRFELVRPLVHRFRGAMDSVTLESELETIQARSEGRELTRRRLLALRYYLQALIAGTCQEWSNRLHGNTNYVRLVEEIDDNWTYERRGGRVALVTFNYDLLLDGALGQIGVTVGPDLPTYVQGQYLLFKPHGSVNWLHYVEGLNRSAHPYYIQVIPGLANGTLHAADSFGFEPGRLDWEWYDPPGIPALSIPIAKKTVFEMPTEHRAALEEAIPQVTHLLVIGWRGNEQHFVELLRGLNRERLASLVVSGSQSSAVEVATRLGLSTDAPAIFDGGFSDLFRGQQLREFLLR